MLMAVTLDGRIAKNHHHFADWTEKADKKMFVELTKKAGVLVMGSRTFETIGRPLPNRRNIILTRNPKPSEDKDCVFTDASPQEILKGLEAEGFDEVIIAGGAQINSLFAKAGLVNELVLTFSPKIFGEGLGLFTPDIEMDLELLEVEKLGENTVFARYKVN